MQRILSCVIVGGGPTGVEFAGELCDFLWKDVPRAFPTIEPHDVTVTLLEAGPTILSAFDSKLISNALRSLKKQGANIRTESTVQCVKEDVIELKSGEKVPFGTLVWSTGVGPHEVINKSPFEKVSPSTRSPKFFEGSS